MKLAIAGGGTGGHLFPGLALAEELLSRGSEHQVMFLGAKGGIEERIIPQHGHKLEILPSLKGGFLSIDVFQKVPKFWNGYLQARRALLSFQADAVVGLGGYASYLPVLAGWGVELPTYILEQNTIPGKATKHLTRLVNAIGVQFPESKEHISMPWKVEHIGNPLRKAVNAVAAKSAAKNMERRDCPENPTLLVVGGSQGAKFLNELVCKAWPKMLKNLPNLNVILVAGKEDYSRAAEQFASSGVRGEVIAFTEKMEELYERADLVLARAGATSLAEISAFALPSILIPYPHAADDHQNFNARAFRMAHAAWSLNQANLEPDRLAQRVADTLLQPDRRRRMAVAAHTLARPDASKLVIDRIMKLAGQPTAAEKPLVDSLSVTNSNMAAVA